MLDYIIVGSGLAGIAFSEMALQNDKTIFVFNNQSQNSSRIAGGLYNPVILKRFSEVWQAKEQLDLLKNPKVATPIVEEVKQIEPEVKAEEVVEEIATEEVTNFAEIMPATTFSTFEETKVETQSSMERKLSEMSQDELFEKLQNYKKLLDNGLILQGEYDNYKKEILSYM